MQIDNRTTDRGSLFTGGLSAASLIFAAMQDGLKQRVLNEVAEASGFEVAEILSTSRKQPLTLWRQIAMVRCLELGMSLNSVGSTFNRDHTTVMSAKRKIAALSAQLAQTGHMPESYMCGLSIREYGPAETAAIHALEE